MSKIGVEFPLDVSQQWDGFNEPGVEHFAGSPFRSLGREGTQNAIDATKVTPTRIKIARIEVATSSIPDISGLTSAVSRCSAGADAESEKAVGFFEAATAFLNKPKSPFCSFRTTTRVVCEGRVRTALRISL